MIGKSRKLQLIGCFIESLTGDDVVLKMREYGQGNITEVECKTKRSCLEILIMEIAHAGAIITPRR